MQEALSGSWQVGRGGEGDGGEFREAKRQTRDARRQKTSARETTSELEGADAAMLN